MNAKQAAKKAAKLADEVANKDGKPFAKTGDTERKPLPEEYEKLYQSEFLKKQISDPGMWSMIPAVSGGLQSAKGIQRLKENHLLFSFIDQYFPDGRYAFEPNMQDGRFVFLPADVSHQGMGVCVSGSLPGFLEIGHFWYPCEYTAKQIPIGPGQVYIPVFSMKPGEELAEMIREVYMNTHSIRHEHYCTFPYEPGQIVRLNGNFMDHLSSTKQKIREALKGCSAQVQRNGEGLIMFMEKQMKNAIG